MSEPPTLVLPAPERRRGSDRRQASWRTLLHSLYRARRQEPRRAGGPGAGEYVDVIRPRIAITSVGIMILSCADCLFTLLLLQRGGREVNPVMDILIATDTTLFVVTKTAITAACVLFIVAHRHFRFLGLRGGHVL